MTNSNTIHCDKEHYNNGTHGLRDSFRNQFLNSKKEHKGISKPMSIDEVNTIYAQNILHLKSKNSKAKIKFEDQKLTLNDLLKKSHYWVGNILSQKGIDVVAIIYYRIFRK